MGDLGDGTGTAYPGAADTDGTQESASTAVRFQIPNDIIAAILAMQGEMGTNPKGAASDVKTFLQLEHNTSGTHDVSLVAMLAGTQTFAGTKTFTADVKIDKATPFLVHEPTADAQYMGVQFNDSAGTTIATMGYTVTGARWFLRDVVAGAERVAWDLADGSLATGIVPGARLVAASVTSTQLGALAATTAKIDNTAITAAKVATDAVISTKIKTASTSLAGTISASSYQAIVLATSGYNFFPMIHCEDNGMNISGHSTDGADPDAARFTIYNGTGGNRTYDVDYRYISTS